MSRTILEVSGLSMRFGGLLAVNGVGLNVKEKQVVSMIGRVPEAQRKTMTLKQAWRTALVRDYPCA